MREFEDAITERMVHDGWEEIPKDGDNLLESMRIVIRYIDKIRQDRDWYASDLYRQAKHDGEVR